MEINVLNINGQETGRKVTLNESIFGIEPNDHVIYLDVSPLLRGGGRVFGPTPRDYGFKLNKKVKALARKSALSYKAQENAIIVVEDFNMDAPKTKEFINIAKNLKVDGKKLLMVLPESNKNVYLSARNLQKAECIIASNVNTYKVLNADVMVITENSLKAIDGVLG